MIGDQLRNKMIIYGHPTCINTAKCLQLAAEKGVDVESVVIDANNPDDKFLEVSPLKVGPALRDIDFTVFGVLGVLSYLDDKGFGPSLVPRNGVTRAIMYQWITVAMSVAQDKVAAGSMDELDPILDALDLQIAHPPRNLKGGFICGEFTLADIHWSACMNMAEIKGHGDRISSRSNLNSWFNQVKSHSSTSKEKIIPFTVVPTADDIESNVLKDISINV